MGEPAKVASYVAGDLLDPDGNFFRDDRRVERIMSGVAQYQLQGVLAGWKFNSGLGLARSKMKMRLVLWNRLIGIDWFIHIDQQMVMAAVLEIIARMSYAHIS